MSCSFCQNYEISQQVQKSEYIETDKLINIIETLNDNIGIAFTYNEPFMWYEYIYDVAKKIKGRNKDISTVLVTNGYVNKEPLEKILPYIDAMNIDLKGYTAKRYLNYVYIGNVAGVDNNTYCPDCNEKLLTRGIYTTTVHIDDNKCDNCGKDINIVL